MKKIVKVNRGFTLVELMVVITIISLLTGIIVTNLTSSKSKARDAKRISDMGQIQIAIELFFDRCREYPVATSNTGDPVPFDYICPTNSSVKLSNYISKIPEPSPEAGETYYKYFTPPSDQHPTDYVLSTTLENYNEVLKDGLSPDVPSSIPSWTINTEVACSNNQTDKKYCLSPK